MSQASHLIPYAQVSLTALERKQQTEMIMQLFKLWQLTARQQAIALGLSPNTETSIYNYKNGSNSLPLYRDLQDRVVHFLAIHKFLRQAYAFNKELAYRWMTTANADFDFQTPFDVIQREGYLGLVKIRSYLEFHQQI
jgi:hypothetical protein